MTLDELRNQYQMIASEINDTLSQDETDHINEILWDIEADIISLIDAEEKERFEARMRQLDEEEESRKIKYRLCFEESIHMEIIGKAIADHFLECITFENFNNDTLEIIGLTEKEIRIYASIYPCSIEIYSPLDDAWEYLN